VPFPHAVDDHQTKNAQFLEQCGAAVLLPQPEFNEARLLELLTEFNHDRQRLQRMSAAARDCHLPAAAERVADALLGSMGKSVPSAHEVRA